MGQIYERIRSPPSRGLGDEGRGRRCEVLLCTRRPGLDDLRRMERPHDLNTDSVPFNICWSDPRVSLEHDGDHSLVGGFGKSDRGGGPGGYSFNQDAVRHFCEEQHVEHIFRGHEVSEYNGDALTELRHS